MLSASQIAPLRKLSDDYDLTEELKRELRNAWEVRKPFYLTRAELERIFKWKLRLQYGRQAALRASTTDRIYQIVTRAAFEIRRDNWPYEATVRLGILTALPGVGVPVASAILALTQPDRYCVIDFRGWRAVFGVDRRSFTVAQYLEYVRQVRRLAHELGWAVQEVDLALWEYDRRMNP